MADAPLAPLKTREVWILGMLAEEPLHGYALLDRLEEASQGAVRVGPATLYRTLESLGARGLIEPHGRPPRASTARHPWCLTESGRRALRRETKALAGLVDRVRDALDGAVG